MAASENDEPSDSLNDITLTTEVPPPPELYEDQDSFMSISGEDADALVQDLANRCFDHRITATTEAEQCETYAHSAKPRYDSSSFLGIMIDTGAAKRSTAGLGQF